jgi:hypothetical protein
VHLDWHEALAESPDRASLPLLLGVRRERPDGDDDAILIPLELTPRTA